MDVAISAAPPVVAVTVVYQPGTWFDDVLAGLAAQDYPNLRQLFLVVGDAEGQAERIQAVLPEAHVRVVAGNPGYGPTADEALRLVEGSGLFCFLHDDVALDPDAITRLVEELYRSNAGIVGPKLVDWDRPQVLQQVGLAVDRFGELDPIVEPDEVDQEQHDAVRDVFALPSACLLVRADLFRTLGGFDPHVDYHGDALDLCWRAHLGGARVLVVPAARARHRGELGDRRGDLAHKRIAARHRVRTVATLTGRWRTPVVLFELVVVSLVEMVVGVFTGRARDGLASLYALVRLVPTLPSVIKRRATVRPLRQVPEHEVAVMQLRGSARLVGFLRHRELSRRLRAEARGLAIAGDVVDRQPSLVALLLVAAFLVGSRQLISGGVPSIGQFVGLPHPGPAWRDFVAAWRNTGFGADAPAPPALVLTALSGLLTFGKMALARTMLVLLPFLLGPFGMWKALSFVPSVRARLGAVVVYAAVPLPAAALAGGRWGALLTYAAVPWAFWLLRLAGGLTVFQGSQWGDDDIADAISPVTTRVLVRIVAGLALLDAVVGAFAPAFPLLVVLLALALALGTVLAGGSRSVLTGVFAAVVALAMAFVLLEPWSFSLLRSDGWDAVAGTPLGGPRGLGASALASFRIGPTTLGVFALALYLPVLAGPLIGRGWRLTWSARAGAVVGIFLLATVLDDRNDLPIRLPEPGIMLAPVALGLSIAAACALAGFERDIRGARFGWRQPLGLLVSLALVAGLFQGVVGVANGRWSAPELGLPTYLSQLPAPLPGIDVAGGAPTGSGDYRVVFVGDPRVMPLAARHWRNGVVVAVGNGRDIELDDQFPSDGGAGDALVAEALDAIATERTDRAGRLLAPLAVRYIVVPVDDAVRSGLRTPVAAPIGLLDALSRQLDLRLVDSPSQLVIYENTAWLPVASMLDLVAVVSSEEAGADSLAAQSVGSGAGVLTGADFGQRAAGTLPAGTLHVAVPDDEHWRLTLDGRPVPTRPAFGWSIAADLAAPGRVELEHVSSGRRLLLLVEGLLVVLVCFAATGARLRWRRRRRGVELHPDDALPLIDLGLAEPPAAEPDLLDLDLPPSSPVGLTAPDELETVHELDELAGFDGEWPDETPPLEDPLYPSVPFGDDDPLDPADPFDDGEDRP